MLLQFWISEVYNEWVSLDQYQMLEGGSRWQHRKIRHWPRSTDTPNVQLHVDPYSLKLSGSVPVPYCFVYCSFVIYVAIRDCGNSSLFFFKIVFGHFQSIGFIHMTCRIIFPSFVNKKVPLRVLIGIPYSLRLLWVVWSF